MALKFNCPKCNQEIIVKYLKVGESAKCQNCGNESIIPGNAITTDEQATIDKVSHAPQEKKEPKAILVITEAQLEHIREYKEKQYRLRKWIILLAIVVLFILLPILGLSAWPGLLFAAIAIILLGFFTDVAFRCPQCNAYLYDKHNFCPQCGLSLTLKPFIEDERNIAKRKKEVILFIVLGALCIAILLLLVRQRDMPFILLLFAFAAFMLIIKRCPRCHINVMSGKGRASYTYCPNCGVKLK